MSSIAFVFLGASLIGNAVQFLLFKSKEKSRPNSIELTEFITDLRLGSGLIKCTRIDPNDVFLKSPKGRG